MITLARVCPGVKLQCFLIVTPWRLGLFPRLDIRAILTHTLYRHALSKHPIDIPCRHIPYQPTISTHPIDTPYQPRALSTYPINTPTPLTYAVGTCSIYMNYKPTLLTHLLYSYTSSHNLISQPLSAPDPPSNLI